MPTKIFTLNGGACPFDNGCEIDSPSCRKCKWFYRAGTGTFFWCNHPIEQRTQKIAQNTPGIEQPKRKRGRPPGKATKKAANRTKNKKR